MENGQQTKEQQLRNEILEFLEKYCKLNMQAISPGAQIMENLQQTKEQHIEKILGLWDEYCKLNMQANALGDEENSLTDQVNSLVDQVISLRDEENYLAAQVISLGDEENPLTDQVNSLGDEESSLTDQVNSLGDEKNSLGDQANSLGDQANSLEDQAISLGDQAISLADQNNLILEQKNLPNVIYNITNLSINELQELKNSIQTLINNRKTRIEQRNEIISLRNQQIPLLNKIISLQNQQIPLLNKMNSLINKRISTLKDLINLLSQPLQSPQTFQQPLQPQAQVQAPQQPIQPPQAQLQPISEIIAQNKGGAYTANNCFYYSLFSFLHVEDICILLASAITEKQNIIAFSKAYIDDIIQNHADINIKDIPSLTLVCITRYLHSFLISNPIFNIAGYNEYQNHQAILLGEISKCEQISHIPLSSMPFAYYTHKPVVVISEDNQIIIAGVEINDYYNRPTYQPYCIQANEAEYNVFCKSGTILPINLVKLQNETHDNYVIRILNLAVVNPDSYISIYLKDSHYVPLNRQDKSRLETELDIQNNPDFSPETRAVYKQLKSLIDFHIDQTLNKTDQSDSSNSLRTKMINAQVTVQQNAQQQSQPTTNYEPEHI